MLLLAFPEEIKVLILLEFDRWNTHAVIFKVINQHIVKEYIITRLIEGRNNIIKVIQVLENNVRKRR